MDSAHSPRLVFNPLPILTMRKISLVVCVFRERDLLDRLLREMAGLYDDLVVVHDGPEKLNSDQPSPAIGAERAPAIDFSQIETTILPHSPYRQPSLPAKPGSIHELVLGHGGQFFEGPRCFQQEPHWPFAWSKAQHDWTFRLDADEFPSADLKEWLERFRAGPEPPPEVSGYTCIWPLWDGTRPVTRSWPRGRIFLIHRRRVRFFGMVEHVPVPDGHYEPQPFVLRHEPTRKSYGLRNILVRQQGYAWRRAIAHSLLGNPLDLPRWRCASAEWPAFWNRLRSHPILYGFYALFRGTILTIRDQWQVEGKIKPLMAVACPLHHMLIGLLYLRLKRGTAASTRRA
jgi:hypothetical protein